MITEKTTPRGLEEEEQECPRCEEFTAIGVKQDGSIWYAFQCPGCGLKWEGK